MCFDWNQTCWASTEEAWETHIQHCTRCMLWMFVECPVPGHESQQKRRILTDIGTRRYVTTDDLGGEIKDQNGKSCCENHLCLHDFTVHGSTNVPWWTCLSNECPEHRSIKERSDIWPTIPKITIKNAQVCPCARKGCECTFEDLSLGGNMSRERAKSTQWKWSGAARNGRKFCFTTRKVSRKRRSGQQF